MLVNFWKLIQSALRIYQDVAILDATDREMTIRRKESKNGNGYFKTGTGLARVFRPPLWLTNMRIVIIVIVITAIDISLATGSGYQFS